MFDYDYEIGIVTFNFDGSEDDLKKFVKKVTVLLMFGNI